MPQYTYHERDYAFGQAMLALYTSIGLTPAGPAVLLGISQRAIDEWENSLNYFKRDSPQYDVRPLNASLSTQYRCKTLVCDEHLGSNVGEASRASPSRNEQRMLPLPDFAERSGLLDNGSTPLHAACLRGMPGSHLLALLCQGPRQYKSVFQGMRRPLPELEWGMSAIAKPGSPGHVLSIAWLSINEIVAQDGLLLSGLDQVPDALPPAPRESGEPRLPFPYAALFVGR